MWSIHLAVLRFPFLVELEFVNFVFFGRGENGNPRNQQHTILRRRRRDSNPGNIVARPVLSRPLPSLLL